MGHDWLFNTSIPGVLYVDRLLTANKQNPYAFIKDQTSNGYIMALYNKMKGEGLKRTEVRNSDFVEYEFISEGKVIKMAKCYGFRNIQKVVQSIKKNKC